jgi:hypothetical protein
MNTLAKDQDQAEREAHGRAVEEWNRRASAQLHIPTAFEHSASKAMAITNEWARGWDDCRQLMLQCHASLPAVQGGQPCKDRCQYAHDIGMPEHYCGNGCMYEKHAQALQDSRPASVAPGGLTLPQADSKEGFGDSVPAPVEPSGATLSPGASAEPIAPADDYHEWQNAVFTLMGYASGLYAEGLHDMPAWFYALAEKIARKHVDEAQAKRVREVATRESAKYAQVEQGESSSNVEAA